MAASPSCAIQRSNVLIRNGIQVAVADAVPFSKRAIVAILAVMGCAAATVIAAEAPVKAFKKNWEGRRVVVQRALLTLVYDEIGRAGTTTFGKRTGLTVATPEGAVYFQFDGRRGVDDLTDRDANRLVTAISEQYLRTSHDQVASLRTIDPKNLLQYAPGGELTVARVAVERDRVRLYLAEAGRPPDEFATMLTVQWPVPFSKDFRESDAVEPVLRQFLAPVVLF